MVGRALEEVPRYTRLWDRDGEKHIILGPGITYFGPGSDALYNVDKVTHEVRPSTLSDLRNNVALADALPGFDFVMSMALPG